MSRWIIRLGSAASCASLVLAWQTAFKALGLDKFYARTLLNNAKVNISLTYSGLKNMGVLPEKVDLGGTLYDVVDYRMARVTWLARRNQLQVRAASSNRLLGGSSTPCSGNSRRRTNGQ